VGAEIERGILRKAQLHTTCDPVSRSILNRGFAFGFDISAAGLGLQRTMQVVKVKVRPIGFRPD